MNAPLAIASYAAVLGAVLAGLRRTKELSQADLASSIGVGASTWSRIESGESALSTEQLALVAERLGTTPSSILAAVEQGVALLGKKSVATTSSRLTAESVAALGVIPLVGASLSSVLLPVVGAVGAAAAGYRLYKHLAGEPKDE